MFTPFSFEYIFELYVGLKLHLASAYLSYMQVLPFTLGTVLYDRGNDGYIYFLHNDVIHDRLKHTLFWHHVVP